MPFSMSCNICLFACLYHMAKLFSHSGGPMGAGI